MNSNRSSIILIVWHYLNQPVFDDRHPAILHPRRFWYLHRIQYLERCWGKNYSSEERFPRY